MTNITEREIESYFDGCGRIEQIEIPKDHITHRPKGYVIIEFSKAYEAKDAVATLDGFEVNKKKIKVKIYDDRL